MYTQFEFPTDRTGLLSKLTERSAMPHGDMMSMMMSKQEVDTQGVWCKTQPSSNGMMLYIHIPFCVSRCAFCGFYAHSTSDESRLAYIDLLIKELQQEADRGVYTARPIDVVYFGGGTPTTLSGDEFRRLIGFIYTHFTIASDVEFTVEGRIFGFDDDQVRACVESGATRFSFGIQTFDTVLRQSLGRRNSREELISRLHRIKDICGDKVALVADLIYGLPGQTQSDWMENLRTVRDDVPLDGVDLYRLKLFPGLPITKRMEREGAWSEEELILRHSEACDYLQGANWRQLSCTHWGRNSLERNRYNQWAKTDIDLIPFGCGAGGAIGESSFMQTSNIDKYKEMVNAGLKPLQMVMPKMPYHAQKARVVDQMERGYFVPSTSPDVDFAPLFDNWQAAGLCTADGDDRFRLTRLGECYQVKLSSMLTGYIFAGAAGMGGVGSMMGIGGKTPDSPATQGKGLMELFAQMASGKETPKMGE